MSPLPAHPLTALQVPRPLPEEYVYITERALLQEARAVAPFHETGQVPHSPSLITDMCLMQACDLSIPLVWRRLQRLQIYFRKSVEYAVIHKTCAASQAVRFNLVTVTPGDLGHPRPQQVRAGSEHRSDLLSDSRHLVVWRQGG